MIARLILIWTLVALGAASCTTMGHVAQEDQAFTDDQQFRRWFSTYYQEPHPERLTAAVRYMHAQGYLDETEGGDMPLIASMFLARVMVANPSEVKTWAETSWQKLGPQEWYVLMVSLYLSDLPQAREVIAANLGKVDRAHQERLAAIQKTPAKALDPLATAVASERQISLLWAAYSATGDARYVQKVISAVPYYGDEDEQKAHVGEVALMSLATNALQNPAVARECAEVNGRTNDKKTRVLLTAMLAAVADIASTSEPQHDAVSH